MGEWTTECGRIVWASESIKYAVHKQYTYIVVQVHAEYVCGKHTVYIIGVVLYYIYGTQAVYRVVQYMQSTYTVLYTDSIQSSTVHPEYMYSIQTVYRVVQHTE